MNDFQRIAVDLIGLSIKIIDLIKIKNQFAKNINYQINQLFQQLGTITHSQQLILIQTNNLIKQMSSNQLNIFYSKDNREYDYLTADDLCNFLHISKHNLKRNNLAYSIDQQYIEMFYNLIDQELMIEQQLVNVLCEVDIQKWFNEVDFFNNDYIDTSALYEYFLHYDSKQQKYEEYNAMLILKFIKRYSNTDKVSLEDLKKFIDKSNIIHILLTNEHISNLEQQSQIKHQQKHIKKKSNQLYSLPSQISITPQIKIGQKLIDHHYLSNQDTLGLMSRRQIEEELKLQENITYQQRLIKLHPRNQKYIRQAKKQMEGIIPICNVQIQSHLQLQASRMNKGQLIRKLRLLGDIYNKIVKLIQVFLIKNSKFTFMNAFALIDIQESNSVDLNNWKQFTKQLGINIPLKKNSIFFAQFSTNSKMKYSNFLQIFKYRPVEEEYARSYARYPLIYQLWSDELFNSFRQFLTKMINLVDERRVLIQSILRQQTEFNDMISPFSYLQEIIELLGNQYTEFVKDYFVENNQKIMSKLITIQNNKK